MWPVVQRIAYFQEQKKTVHNFYGTILYENNVIVTCSENFQDYLQSTDVVFFYFLRFAFNYYDK